MKKFVLKSMGCKSNQYEGSLITQSLIDNDFVITEEISEADYFILNSCTVTQKTDNKAFYILRNAKHINPNIKTVLTGCIAQVEKETLLDNDFIDFVIGNDEKLNIAEFLISDTKFAVGNIMVQEKFNNTILLDTSKTRACVKIQDGCDNRCSYCVIPFARGKSRSASKDFILNQINTLYSQNFKEIVLTGIHIGQWGKDINETFFHLLKFLEENSPIERIRMGSINPLEINAEILDFLASSKKFCPHFHLSLQSACNETLKRMNRFYTVEHYLEQIEQREDFTYRRGSGEYSPADGNIVPGKYIEAGSGIVKYNDKITWAYCSVRDMNSHESTAHVGFKFPYTVIDYTTTSVSTYENGNYADTSAATRIDDGSHPFYEK